MPLIEVKPLPAKKWHGKDGKESFTQPKVIEALYNRESGAYATGLTEEEAIEYGKKLGVNLSNVFNPNEPHEFWSTKAAMVKLENSTMFFDTSKPMDFIRLKLLKASKFVANSLKDYEDNKYPDATHVIYDEQEQVSLRAAKVQQKNKATVIASKMSSDDKAAIILLLSEGDPTKNYKGKSPDAIDVELDDILNSKAEMFIRYANMGREEVHIRASVLQLIQRDILTKEAGSVFYMGEMIGVDYEAAVAWFKNPTNQKLQIAILEKLEK